MKKYLKLGGTKPRADASEHERKQTGCERIASGLHTPYPFYQSASGSSSVLRNCIRIRLHFLKGKRVRFLLLIRMRTTKKTQMDYK